MCKFMLYVQICIEKLIFLSVGFPHAISIYSFETSTSKIIENELYMYGHKDDYPILLYYYCYYYCYYFFTIIIIHLLQKRTITISKEGKPKERENNNNNNNNKWSKKFSGLF